MALGASACRRRLTLDEVSSTNTVALEAARAGDPGPLWVTAERQSAGRGRRGRNWVSERGNLYASWLLIDPAPLTQLSNLPLVASLGVRNGLARLVAEGDTVAVKWPNDVLIKGRKTVGILLESERLPDGRMAVVVGCGINVAHVPDDTPYPVTSLALEGATHDLEAVFGAVAAEMERVLAIFAGGRGFSAIRNEWLAHAVGVGQPCRVNLADAVLTGRFEALDEHGLLLLRDAAGRVTAVSAGDLFFLERDERVAPSGSGAA
ncbi:biotin--acetyl-CoA-carboxylase ligase [Aurantimonas manganoxydans SI85-9A1]|uniref:biotin--[biotin carboxyl-carrier protein] ligase n=1 Tax=Aurantimonas manganoxydans (strain ATCC BAA-1229 / DSM 21871 / SI85-9A1) TaxID=287752 RepID=Q1YN79_AURMS|nr:biotin--[acetyl-CoA-carboxylase] ligase [Aurantimonas manganoxydans]EAS51152.1 biotin--acetyl-CoA-carboxylase ligase [Aurantimonas manganoxydans SI85-9A1]